MRLPPVPRRLILVIIAALLAAIPNRAYAQAGTSGLTGVVTDPSGTPMDRVHIVVLDPLTGFSRETETNNTGNYNVPGLRPGTYSVVATRDGFRTFTETAFRVAVEWPQLRAARTARARSQYRSTGCRPRRRHQHQRHAL